MFHTDTEGLWYSQRHRSKRACVSVYPSMEQQGILWFWSDLSQGPVNIEAAANPPPVFSELSDPDFGYDISLRDLEYSLASETLDSIISLDLAQLES